MIEGAIERTQLFTPTIASIFPFKTSARRGAASYIESQVLDRTLLISRQITPFAAKLLFVSPVQSWDPH
jgi:hypothetical protein